MTSRQQEYRMGVGASSVLMIFVVLCLTTLGVLSFASARADLMLTQRRKAYVESYYQADAAAQRVLFQIDEQLALAKKDPEEYEQAVRDIAVEGVTLTVSDDLTIAFPIEISESLRLEVAVRALGPEVTKRYETAYYRMVNIGDWSPDTSYTLYSEL